MSGGGVALLFRFENRYGGNVADGLGVGKKKPGNIATFMLVGAGIPLLASAIELGSDCPDGRSGPTPFMCTIFHSNE